jgi:glycosyltransferase involved in cell wall biosynthesis
VMIFPNYVTPPVSLGLRTVTVIHDLLYRHRPDIFRTHKRAWLRCSHRITVECASRVVTISASAAADIRRWYGSAVARRLVTIPNPIDWTRFDAGAGDNDPFGGRPYLLSVAAEWPHKNIATLLKAFARMRRSAPDCGLVLVGQIREHLKGRTTQLEPGIAETIQLLGLDGDVIQTGHVADGDLGRWYRHARGFVFPSLFEGFGMPPVEALGLGLPVVTTQCASIPESTRQLAYYVRDPLDAEELADVLIRLFYDPHAFTPSSRDVAALRSFYAPARVARLYADVALN